MEVKKIVCDYRNLYDALQRCKRGVAWKDSVAGYCLNALLNIKRLKERLENGTYTIRPYTEFTVHEPKERLIQSTHIVDRVFQDSLCTNYLYHELTKGFVYDNGACLQNKGTEFSRKRLKTLLQRHYRKHGLVGGVLKCDLKNYFGSTLHSTAIEAVRRRVKDEWATAEVERIIRSFSHGEDPPCGIGLGSRVSQLIQLAVMDDIDHYIKEVLHIKYYVRYMDDFILIHYDKDYLKYCLSLIRQRIEAKGLKTNKKKTHICPIAQPIHFLGFSFRLTDTGGVIVKLLSAKVAHEKRKLKKLVGLVKQGKMTRKKVDECYTAWKAHATGKRTSKRKRRNKKPNLKRNNHALVLKMDKYYKGLWKGV